MPWDADTFKKHDKKLTKAQSKEAAKIANALLAEGKDEATAISIAISRAKVHHPPVKKKKEEATTTKKKTKTKKEKAAPTKEVDESTDIERPLKPSIVTYKPKKPTKKK